MSRYVVQYFTGRSMNAKAKIVRAASQADALALFAAKHAGATVIYCDLASHTND